MKSKQKISLVNLTQHKIRIFNGNDIEPSGMTARVDITLQHVEDVDGIPILELAEARSINVPPEKENTMYIVPALVRNHLPHRTDLISPTNLVRDHNNVVVGCAAFERNSKK